MTPFVDTSPQFESQVLTAPENSNVSIELNVSALNKRRGSADIFIMIVKGFYKTNLSHKFCFECECGFLLIN